MGLYICRIVSCWVLCGPSSWTRWEGGLAIKGSSGSVLLGHSKSILSIVLNPCFHFVFVSESKLTSIIAYTILTHNILVCTVLFTENTVTVCGYCGKFSFLCPMVCQPDSMLCHVLGFTEDNFCILGLSHLASLLQGGVGFEPCMPSIALSTRSFNHQISGLHWWLYKRPQISVAASSRGPFSIDKSDTTQCAVPALAPAVVATAATTVADFTFKAD